MIRPISIGCRALRRTIAAHESSSAQGVQMSHSDADWQAGVPRHPDGLPSFLRYPDGLPPYLIDYEGHVYTPLSDDKRWQRTNGTEPVAASILRQSMIEAAKERMIVRPAQWAAISGEPLYYDPRLVQPIVYPVLTSPETPKMNSLASTARVFGWLSILFTPCALIALVCGYAALGQIRDRGEGGREAAMTGIIIGWIIVGLFLVLLILIVSH